MVDNRTNFAREIAALLRETYGSKIKVFAPRSPTRSGPKRPAPRARVSSPTTPGGKVAEAYKNLTKEVLTLEKQRERVELASVDDLFSTEESRATPSGRRFWKFPCPSCTRSRTTPSKSRMTMP